MNCCNHNCREGRDCPLRKPMDVAAAVRYLHAYLAMWFQYFDHAAAKSAGHLAAITKPEPPAEKASREPMDPQAVVIVVGCIATWLGVYLASIWPFWPFN